MGYLLEKHLGWPRSALISKDQDPLPDVLIAEWKVLELRRSAGEPVAYLIGHKAFHRIELKVNPAVLIPRPETELLVDLAIEEIKRRVANAQQALAIRILDLGTGSGAIALAIANSVRTLTLGNATITVMGTDLSKAAIELAQENAKTLGLDQMVHWLESDWYQNIPQDLIGRFDLIVSNPPYIDSKDPHLNTGDLRFEPRHALTDEYDGLGCIRSIVDGCKAYLCENGLFAIEHGYDQAKQVQALMQEAGLLAIESKPDLAGHLRMSLARKANKTPLANRP